MSVGQPGLVSVVVASYNHAEFLEQRMRSLLAQTYEDIEIIVIDDRSTDDSVAVLRRFEADPRVRLIVREQNGGWVAVSNQGVDLSSGQFVIFANCDDDCEPRMIERLVGALRDHPSAGLAFCRSLLVDDAGDTLGDDFVVRSRAFRARCASDTVLRGEEFTRFLLESCVVPNLSAALFGRECFATVGYLSPSYRVVGDWDLFFRVGARYDVCYVAEALNRFRQHPATIRSSTKERIVYEEYLHLLLPQLRTMRLPWGERWRARTEVMSIWALHIVAPSWSGLRDVPHHLRLVLRHDALALATLPVALAGRIGTVLRKLVGRDRRTPTPRTT